MRQKNFRGFLWLVVLCSWATTAEAIPVQIYYQGTVGIWRYLGPSGEFFSVVPPAGLSPTETFYGSFFVDSAATDLNSNSFVGSFLVNEPFTLRLGGYTAVSSQMTANQEQLSPSQMEVFFNANAMTTDVPGAPNGSGFLSVLSPGNANVMTTDPSLWFGLPSQFRFEDTAGNLVFGFGGNITSANVPEPTTFALLASGIAAAGMKHWRRRRAETKNR
jgi:PEP-CTERM motif-containing protein